MSHSQFHCTARVYLDMHGLIFETSICYWQDQPGSRATGHDPTGPARRRPLSLLPSLSLSPARSAFPSGPCRVDGGGRRGERLSAGRAALRRSLARSLARRPRRRGAPDPRGGPADLPPAGKERGPLRSCFRRHAPGPPRGSRTRARAARPAGADPPSGTGREADGETKPRRRRRTC